MQLGNANFKNHVFHLTLSPPFRIFALKKNQILYSVGVEISRFICKFATNTAITSDDGQTVADKLPEAPQPFTAENL
jgi:hypothetical protein